MGTLRILKCMKVLKGWGGGRLKRENEKMGRPDIAEKKNSEKKKPIVQGRSLKDPRASSRRFKTIKSRKT